MTQSIYDNEEFFEAYGQLCRSVAGLERAPEWPALRALLSDLRGLRVLDLFPLSLRERAGWGRVEPRKSADGSTLPYAVLKTARGCGFGWFCRWARQQGAAHILGVDVSERMLARARATSQDAAITYIRADIEHLELPPESLDLAYSSLALHYVEHLDELMSAVYRSLVPGGRLVFSVEHPMITGPADPRWGLDTTGRKAWPVNGYLDEGPRSTDWLIKGVIKQHRTLATYINMLLGVGFTLSHVEEWGPTEEQIAARPNLADERQRPLFLLVAARR